MKRLVNGATDASDMTPAAESEARSEAAQPTPAERVMAQLGGVSGMIYSSLPVLVFVGTSRLLGLAAAVGAALGIATLILVHVAFEGEELLLRAGGRSGASPRSRRCRDSSSSWSAH